MYDKKKRLEQSLNSLKQFGEGGQSSAVEIINRIRNSNFKTGYIKNLQDKMNLGKVLSEYDLDAARKAFKTIDEKEACKVDDKFPDLEEMRRIREERKKLFAQRSNKN